MSSAFDVNALTVLLDVRHPLAYLALRPAIVLGQSLPVEIDWLPLETPTLKAPSEPRADDDRAIRHRRHRAHAIAREIDAYANAQALEICDPYRNPDPAAAHLGWLWVREHARTELVRFLEELFRRYWSAALDPSDPAPVAALLDELGLDAAAFRHWAATEGPQAAEVVATDLRERGFFQVPTFVLNEEPFVGRQHLPMIRWIIEGRTGPIPI